MSQPLPGDLGAQARFREVLGHFPTGVAVITGIASDDQPVGMAIGSFASVSLDPPLVAFMPDRQSRSWPRVRASGHFCVNILGSDQEAVCRTFAVSGGDKFAELAWRPSGSGSPILDGVVAWIDCEIEVVHEAGDHFIVIGAVRDLQVETGALPLVFFQGGYGRFSALSLAAWESDLVLQMRSADLARPYMEELAEELEVECVASAVVGAELVLVARAGRLPLRSPSTAVGQRVPFEPPAGLAFVAWASEVAQRAWFARSPSAAGAVDRDVIERTLTEVRENGYSIDAGHQWRTGIEVEGVRTVSVPVFGPGGVVVLVLSVLVAARGTHAADLAWTVERLRSAAAAVTEALAGSDASVDAV